MSRLLLLLPLFALACASPEEGQEATASVRPYPLETCIVSDEPLGSMGDPVVVVRDGQEYRFCCSNCVAAFDKDPSAFVGKLETK